MTEKRNRTTIRLALSPSEVLASLEMLELLGGSTENRTFSSCVEQLYRALLVKSVEVKGLTFTEDYSASVALNARKKASEIDVNLGPEELRLMEDDVRGRLNEERMLKINKALAKANQPPEDDFGTVFGNAGELKDE